MESFDFLVTFFYLNIQKTKITFSNCAISTSSDFFLDFNISKDRVMPMYFCQNQSLILVSLLSFFVSIFSLQWILTLVFCRFPYTRRLIRRLIRLHRLLRPFFQPNLLLLIIRRANPLDSRITKEDTPQLTCKTEN